MTLDRQEPSKSTKGGQPGVRPDHVTVTILQAAVGSEYAQSILSPIRAHADLMALVVAHGHIVSTSFEGGGSVGV